MKPYFLVIIIAICDIRLDFDTYTLNGPSDTSETDGGKCQDSLTITTVDIIKLYDITIKAKIQRNKNLLISEYWSKCTCYMWRKFRPT